MRSIQSWTKKAERIKCPAPLLEDPRVTAMLIPAPYKAPEKKAKKKGKEVKSQPHRASPMDTRSKEIGSQHSPEEGEEEE